MAWLYNHGMQQKMIVILIVLLGLTSCSFSSKLAPESPTEGATLAPSVTLPSPTDTALPAFTPTLLPSATPTSTDTPTPVPTYIELIGEVNVDRLACRYGPGWPYLYFTGLRKGNRLEVIGRLDDANWIWVQAIGGNRPCWIKAEFMDVNGDLMSVEPVYPGKAKLPITPYYSPTTVLSATREGNKVTVTWLDIPLKAGDEENERMNHYIIEVWRCEGGQIRFEPLATNSLEISFVDEPGCSEPSHGGVIVQDKHGFTVPAEIPWPPHKE
jgi:hypothetical protein